MSLDRDEPVQVLLAELRNHAKVCERWRAVLPGHGLVKGISESDARRLAAAGGTVERAELWVLPGGYQVLTRWVPADEEPS